MNYLSRHLGCACTCLFLTGISYAQPTAPEKKVGDSTREMHIAIEKFPKTSAINYLDGWGGMAVAVNEMPKGTDLGPLLAGLKDNLCQVPHWGYIIKGALRVKYGDGSEALLKTGDIFYMPPGHTGIVEENLKIMDFSPDKEMKELIKHIQKKLSAPKQ